MTKHVRHNLAYRPLRQISRSFDARKRFRSERRDVARICLGENESPFSRSLGAESNRNHPIRLQQIVERVTARSFLGNSDTRANILPTQIAGAIEQVRELVVRSRAPPRSSTTALGERLLYRFECDVVASFATHHLVEHRPVEGQQRSTLLGARRVVAVQPVHDEAELQARRERRWYLRLDRVDANISGRDFPERVLQSLHVERFLQNFAIGLDENRETRELTHCLKQIERLETLQP